MAGKALFADSSMRHSARTRGVARWSVSAGGAAHQWRAAHRLAATSLAVVSPGALDLQTAMVRLATHHRIVYKGFLQMHNSKCTAATMRECEGGLQNTCSRSSCH